MSKCHEWFKSLVEALEKDPNWDINLKETASKPIPDRVTQTKSSQKINNLITVPEYEV